MSPAQWSDVGFLLLAAISGTVFMIVYTYRSAWWHEEHRAHLAIFTGALTIILWLYVFRSLIPMPTFAIVRRVSFDAISLLMVWRLWLLLRSKRKDRARTDRENAVRNVH
jgi:FlaA1/EpsC-like NDP-sugar epimerase